MWVRWLAADVNHELPENPTVPHSKSWLPRAWRDVTAGLLFLGVGETVGLDSGLSQHDAFPGLWRTSVTPNISRMTNPSEQRQRGESIKIVFPLFHYEHSHFETKNRHLIDISNQNNKYNNDNSSWKPHRDQDASTEHHLFRNSMLLVQGNCNTGNVFTGH